MRGLYPIPGRPLFGVSRLADAILIAAINGYQKRISPHKGWRCAYGKLHGGTGCSGFVKNAIREHGWQAAVPMARERFQQCKLAGVQLRAKYQAHETSGAHTNSKEEKRRRRRERRRDRFDICDGCDWCNECHIASKFCNFAHKICDAVFDCGPGDSGCIDCSPCDGDCTPCN